MYARPVSADARGKMSSASDLRSVRPSGLARRAGDLPPWHCDAEALHWWQQPSSTRSQRGSAVLHRVLVREQLPAPVPVRPGEGDHEWCRSVLVGVDGGEDDQASPAGVDALAGPSDRRTRRRPAARSCTPVPAAFRSRERCGCGWCRRSSAPRVRTAAGTGSARRAGQRSAGLWSSSTRSEPTAPPGPHWLRPVQGARRSVRGLLLRRRRGLPGGDGGLRDLPDRIGAGTGGLSMLGVVVLRVQDTSRESGGGRDSTTL
jgi:hypothetical protein